MDKDVLIPCEHEIKNYCNGSCSFSRSKVPNAFKSLTRVKGSYVRAYEKRKLKRLLAIA